MMLRPFHVTGWALYALMVPLGLVSGTIPTPACAAAPEVMGRPRLAGIGLVAVSRGMHLRMVAGPILFGMRL